MRRLLVGMLACFIVAVSLGAQAPDSTRIDAVFRRFTAGRSPGCALNVIADGQSIYERGYGYASLELGVPITPRTVFDIGSVSKQFTAASIVLLAQDGKLSLDDDVRQYVPALPRLAPVTLRQLLHHTSGWRDYTELMTFAGWDERDHTTDADALGILTRQRALNFPPGTAWRYSNTGYFLLSLVVKRVAGKSLREFAAERIFGPLGMTDTRFLDDTRQVVPGRATGYTPADSGGGWQVEMSNWDQVGDGAVQTTVEDLAKWDANFYAPKVGGQALLDLLQTPGHLVDGSPLIYGFGLMRDQYNHETRIWHTGAWGGYRAVIMRFPERRRSIIALCNLANAGTYRLATGVADILLPDTIKATQHPEHEPITSARLTGLYASDAVGDILRVKASPDSVVIEVGARHHMLLPVTESTLRDPQDGTMYEFGKDRVIARDVFDVPDTMRRVAPPAPQTPALAATFAGRYTSVEVGVTWTVVATGARLTIHPRRGDDVTLAPLDLDGYMASDGTPIRFLRDATGHVAALSITSGGVHDLRFTRQH